MQIPPKSLPDTTVLVYTSASPDLEKPVQDSLDELAGSVHRDDLQVVAQMGSRGQAVRSLLNGNASEVVPNVDMSKPQSLQDFLSWGMKKYPAKHYVVVVGGHGAGAFGVVTDSKRSHMMQLPQLRQAIEDSGCRPQMVIFNACLMAQAETVTELAGVTPVVVGSQTAEQGLGMPLGAWLQQTPSLDDPVASAALLVKDCALESVRSPEVSAFRTDVDPALEAHLRTLGQVIRQNPQQRDHIREVLASQPHLWDRDWDRPLIDQIDLGRLAEALGNDEHVSPEIRQASQKLVADLQKMIVSPAAEAQPGLSTDPHGLSIYAPHAAWESMPTPSGPLKDVYDRLRLSSDTGWAQTLSWLVQAGPPIPLEGDPQELRSWRRTSDGR